MLTVGSLFSGIGGLELGLERAGMKTIWQCERDPYARAVLAKNFPGVPCYDDVTQLDPAALVRPDVVCGGFPCQPHSLAGKRGASSDERDLWHEFVRVLRGTRPRWVLAENVPGLLSSERGRFFGRVLEDLASLGFDAEWTVRGARDVGAPHRRDRLFILAYPHGQRFPGRPQPDGRPQEPQQQTSRRNDALRLRKALADINGDERDRRGVPEQVGWQRGQEGHGGTRHTPGDLWPPEPDVGRVADGVPSRVDRLRCLGNAVVPQVAEEIGRLIVAAHRALTPV